jgi:hypothetical protein
MSMLNKTVLVHARNVTGLGASLVVESIINSLESNKNNFEIFYVNPNKSSLFSTNSIIRNRLLIIHDYLPNSLFRLIECFFPRLFYPVLEHNIVLGDLPLRGLNNQLLFVHQQNLIKPKYNSHSSTCLKFVIMRKLFEWNKKYVTRVIVQSDVMADQIVDSYSFPKEIIHVLSHPPPFHNKLCSFKKKR